MSVDSRRTAGGIAVGVIGVGAMGQHHARVFHDLPGVELVGVCDVDSDAAQRVAEQYDVVAMGPEELYDHVDAVSVVVPTPYHNAVVRQALQQGVHTLVEKPFVAKPAEGRALIELAEETDTVLQVGHIERFNPAVRVLEDIVPSLDVISVQAERLGPPPGREIADDAVMDLMIHDLDIVRRLIGEEPINIDAAGVRQNHVVMAALSFESDVFATLSASRMTQKKIRTIEITAESCYLFADLVEQSVEIHRRSVPEYLHVNGHLRYRHEGIVQRIAVDRGEPLELELQSFLQVVANGGTPEVTAYDGLRALELVLEVQEQSRKRQPIVAGPAVGGDRP